MRALRKTSALLCALGCLISAGDAAAQEKADVGQFRAPVTTNGLIGIDGSTTLYPGQFTFGVTAHYARNPVAFRFPELSSTTFEPVVGQQLFADLSLGLGIFYGIDLGVVLPTVLRQRGPRDAGFGDLSGGGLGDLRLVPRVQLIEQSTFGVDVALVPEVIFPTGDSNRFLGDPTITARPQVIVGRAFDRLRLEASVAWRLRSNARVAEVDLADTLTFGTGAAFDVIEDGAVPLTLLAELSGTTRAADPFAADGLGGLEVLGGVRTTLDEQYVITLAGAGGLTQAVGTPTYRVILGFAFAPTPPDRDGDGLPDIVDKCPLKPEDVDGYKDDDGCPDLDNDGDGILDVDDGCPMERETINGIEDDDGCPDGEAGDRDGDGIADDDDDCPDRAEDFDGHRDEDGCPDPDNDFDGVPDSQDQCPEEHESINGIDDDDGCPDEGEAQTEIVERKIEIQGTVLFETAKSTIRNESKNLLDQVALTIKANPQIRLVRVEGHTDDRGASEDNLFLSQDRADSVRRYLIGRGVEPERLVAEGYGEEQPIDTNDTAKGRQANRRVDFVIIEIDLE
jgi:outer membrane protein OmpA-like peptidoglycan-associated protein